MFHALFSEGSTFFFEGTTFFRGGAKFSIFQRKFKDLKSSIIEYFLRLGIFCRFRNFCIGYTKSNFCNVCLQNRYWIHSIDSGMLKTWRKCWGSEESRNQHVFSGKNDVVLTCKITCTKAYKSVHPEIFGFVGSNQFNWELVPYVSWLSNLYKKQICIFASKSTLRRFVKMKL